MKKICGVVGSIAIHLLLLLFLLHGVKHPPPPPPQPPVQVRMEEEEKDSRLKGEEEQNSMALACSGYTYKGIGVRMAYDIVIEVGANTPAEKAGIQVNDEFLDPGQLGQDRHPVGTVVQLRVKRQGREMIVPVTVNKICSE